MAAGTLGAIAVGSLADSQHKLASFAAGWFLVLLNLVLLALIGFLLLRKKLIALAGPVIVIKYAILGIFIYRLMLEPWADAVFFLVGVATLLVTVSIQALQRQNGV